MKKRVVKVTIPPGVHEGQAVRVGGEGEPGAAGGPHGDLHCYITVKQHTLFSRHNNDLVCQIPISFTQASLRRQDHRADAERQGRDGNPGRHAARGSFKLRGKGLPDLRSKRAGDELVQILIEIPRKLSEKQKQILRDFAATEDASVLPQTRSFLEKNPRQTSRRYLTAVHNLHPIANCNRKLPIGRGPMSDNDISRDDGDDGPTFSLDDPNELLDGDLRKLQQERDNLFEQLARTQADFRNAQKRLESDKQQAIQYANSKLITSILPVIDNFERALAADPAKSDLNTLLKGLQITYDQLMTQLRQQNVEPIAPEPGTPSIPISTRRFFSSRRTSTISPPSRSFLQKVIHCTGACCDRRRSPSVIV